MDETAVWRNSGDVCSELCMSGLGSDILDIKGGSVKRVFAMGREMLQRESKQGDAWG